MFEKFTSSARAAVTGAVARAERAGGEAVDEQYLLLALLDEGALRPFGVDPAPVAADLARARRRGGLSQADEAALAGLGIDLSEIVARVEETHGEGALERGGPARRRWSGNRRLTPGAKKTLEQSLRIALARGDRHIGTEHLLLALLSRPGPAAEALADHGITYESATRALPDAAA